MDCIVRYFKTNEIDLLQKSIDELWSHNHILSKNKALLTHMFFTNPAHSKVCQDDEFSFLGLWDSAGKVKGLLGVMPYDLNITGSDGFSAALANWIVDRSCKGWGLELLSKVYELNPDLILGIGINRTVAKLYKLMKWCVRYVVPRWIGFCDTEKCAELFCDNPESLLLSRWWKKLSRAACGKRFAVDAGFDALKYARFCSCFSDKTCGVSRNYNFIKWRYIDFPGFKYNLFPIIDTMTGEYAAFAVTRIERILNNQYEIGRILEFISFNGEASVFLANEIISSNCNVLFWDFYCVSDITAWGLECVGFRKKPSWLNECVAPSRFQPLDLNVVDMAMAMYISDKIKDSFNYADDPFWYITKADGDQDRPN